MAATDFTANRNNSIKIISQGPDATAAGISGSSSGLPISSFSAHSPYLLTPQQRDEIEAIHAANRGKLTVPRRPHWEKGVTTAQELDRLEKDSFLEWRRQLAQLQDNQDLLLTPFERNIEVWRQLWRVIERSDLVVQIVDARNPLFFRSEDLEAYVKEHDSGKKHNLLLINKADLLTETQRKAWANYFKKNEIRYAFFSAFTALKEQEEYQVKLEKEEELRQRNLKLDDNESEEEDDDEDYEDEDEDEDEEEDEDEDKDKDEDDDQEHEREKETEEKQSPPAETLPVREILKNNPIHVLTVEQLEELFLTEIPKPISEEAQNNDAEEEENDDTHNATKDKDINSKQKRSNVLNIGLVGYPNVGKSSTINALIGAKKVSVSATPGKTKHFQTINLSSDVILCDCPGLVFPNFSNTNAELVCNGVLPIDQLREFTGPASLVTQRIPKFFLEAVYGITVFIRPIADGGSGIPTAQELLSSYARARGFMRAGKGSPDESRAARYILKDYVNAKLLYCQPPPGWRPSTQAIGVLSKNNDGEISNEKSHTDPDQIGSQFNSQLYQLSSLPENRRQQILLAIAKSRYGETATIQTFLNEVQQEYQLNADINGSSKKLTVRELEDTIDLAEELESLSFSQHIPLDKLGAGANALKNLQLSAARTASSQAVISAGSNFDRDFFDSSSTWGHQTQPFHKKGGKAKGGKYTSPGTLTSATKKEAKKKRRAGAAAGVGIYSDVY